MTWDISDLGHNVYNSTVAAHVLLFRAHGMSDKQFVMPTALSFRHQKSAKSRTVYKP